MTLSLLALLLALPLLWLECPHGELLAKACDVGPSAGYYGCLGLALRPYSRRVRLALIAAVFLLLTVRALAREYTGDTAE